MKGLLVWAHSYCRSTFAFYAALAHAFDVPLRVLVWCPGVANRRAVGHSDDEFDSLDVHFLGDNEQVARRELESHSGWHHIFGTYQKGRVFRKMLVEAQRRGAHVAVASEAPCNMTAPPARVLKQLYIDAFLPWYVLAQIKAADFILNLSGEDESPLLRLGWPSDKIVACGYYSPPLVGSTFRERTEADLEPFRMLMTGEMQWHRDPLVFLRAVLLLRRHGVRCEVTVTQSGALLQDMKDFAIRHALDVSFAGFLPYPDLLRAYSACSVFVATGRAEPWGMRVNDALHCGAPLIISDGMGAAMLPRRYKCGAEFRAGDEADLARAIETLAGSQAEYLRAVGAVAVAHRACMPEAMAAEVASRIKSRYSAWSN